MGWVRAVLTAMLLVLVSLPLTAEVKQEITRPDTLYLGTRFFLTVTADIDLADIAVPDTLTKYSILKTEKIKSFRKPVGLKLTIAPLDTGEHTFPPLALMTVKPLEDSLRTEPFTLLISELRSPQDTTLVDIAGTQKLRGELPYWAYYAIAGILLLAALIAAFIYIRRYLRQKVRELISPPPPVDNRPNWKRAMDALQALKDEELPEAGQFIAFHYRLSEIMKLFLEAEYKFSANEMTTREIRQYIKKQNFLSLKDQKIVTDWLEKCDRVKFAKWESTTEQSYELLESFAEWLSHKGRAQASEPAAEEESD